MQITDLAVPDAFVVTAESVVDDRGSFVEWYRADILAERTGYPLKLRQANRSVSHKDVVRGVHFAETPPGQVKYVTVTNGVMLDFIIDLRVGSPAFGSWDMVELSGERPRSVFLAAGLGHCIVALTEGAVVSYLVSEHYDPERERGIDPFDPEIGLEFPAGLVPIVSAKDRNAMSLSEAGAHGLLPDWEECTKFYEFLRQENG